jgi:serine/threonine-protein kinase
MFGSGPCSYVARIGAGPDTGTIEGLAQTKGVFATLPDAYESRFGIRPDLRERPVTAAQCAVLDLARELQGGAAIAPQLTLDSTQMRIGGSVVGQIVERRGRPLWLVLVTPAGGIYNLSDRLTAQPDGSTTFSFGLTTPPDDGPAPHLILAVASDTALINAAAQRDGMAADALLPLIMTEIDGRGGGSAAAVAWFELVP